MKKKALVFIDHDMTIRHFVLSGAFKEVEAAYDVTYVFNFLPPSSHKTWVFTDIHTLGLKRVLTTSISRVRMGRWYHLFAASVLYRNRGTSNFAPRRDVMIKMNGEKWTRRYEILSQPGIYQVFRWLYARAQGIHREVDEIISRERPDIILHPSILAGFYINELLGASKKYHIPLVVLMNSWDNPSGKAVSIGYPEKLVVWGEQTRRHAIEFMGMPKDRVVAFGAAQFQVYRTPPTDSDSELRTMFGCPQDERPILLYAGASKGAHESLYLKLLDDAIETGKLPLCHVIYRPHPWRGTLAPGEQSFFDLECKHTSIDPTMEDYYRRAIADEANGFHLADYALSNKLLSLVSAVISPLSTMLLEAALLGKPVLMFFPYKDLHSESGRYTALSLRLAHFADFFGAKGVTACYEESDFVQCCQELLTQSHDNDVRQAIRQHAAHFVDMSDPPYATKLLKLVDELTA